MADARVVALADKRGNDGIGAHRNAHEEVDEQADDGGIAADCRERIAADKVTDDGDVD